MSEASEFIGTVEKVVKQFNDGLVSDEEAEQKILFLAVLRFNKQHLL